MRARLLLFAFMVSTLCLAQTQRYGGQIVDADSGEPLPFAKIYISKDRGTVTNYEGGFVIEAAPDDLLKISYVGYISQSFMARDLPQAIQLKALTQQMHEITVRPIEPLLVKVSKKVYAEYRKNKKASSTYFLRIRQDFFSDSTIWSNHKDQMTEAFIKGYSAINLRTPVALTGYRSGWAPHGLHGSGYQWIHLGVMMYGDDIDMVANDIITPLSKKASKKYYETNYCITYETIKDERGRSLCKVRFRRWEDVKKPVITGTLLIDNTSLEPISFDGQLENTRYLLLVDEYRTIESVKPKFHIDYRHDRGFTEVANLFSRNRMSKMDERYTMVNVGNLNLQSGITIDDNFWSAIDSAGFDADFWMQHETVMRTADEEALFSMARNKQEDTFRISLFGTEPDASQHQQSHEKRITERHRRDSIAMSRIRGILLYDSIAHKIIPFADITVIGKNRTMSNLNGFFLCDLWTDDTLLFNASGYQPKLLPATKLKRIIHMTPLKVEKRNPKDIQIDQLLAELGTKLLNERRIHADKQSSYYFRRLRKIQQDTVMTEALIEARSALQVTQPKVTCGHNIANSHNDSLSSESLFQRTSAEVDSMLMEMMELSDNNADNKRKATQLTRKVIDKSYDKMTNKKGDFRKPFVPLLGTGKTRHYRRHYDISSELFYGADGHKLLRIRFDKKRNWRYPVVTGYMLVDLDSMNLLSFDGALDGTYLVTSSIRDVGDSYIRPSISIHYDFCHDRGFTEVWHAGFYSGARDLLNNPQTEEWYLLMNTRELSLEEKDLESAVVRTYEEEKISKNLHLPLYNLLPPLITFDIFSEKADWRLIM